MEVFERYQECWRVLYHSYNIYPRSRVFVSDPSLGHIHALEIGDGEPLVLLHGFGSNSDIFAALLADLSKKYRVIVPDLPGVGLSGTFNYGKIHLTDLGVKYLRALFEYLEIEKAHIAATSLGAFIAYQFAKSFPEKVERLAILGPLPGFNDQMPFALRLLTLPFVSRNSLPGESRFDVNGTRIFYGRFFVQEIEKMTEGLISTLHFAAVLPGVIRSYFGMFQNFYGFFGPRSRYKIKRETLDLQVPYHFIIGGQDPFFSKENLLGPEANNMTMIPDAGHMAWLDRRKDLLIELHRFLDGAMIDKEEKGKIVA